MARVHAFADDALGKAGRRGPRRGHPRSASVDPGGRRRGDRPDRAHRRRPERARPRPLRGRTERCGTTARWLLRRTPHVRQGQLRPRRSAHDARHGRVRTRAGEARRRLRADAPRHRSDPVGQDPPLGVRLQPVGGAPAPGTRPVTLVNRSHRRRLVRRVGGAGRRRGHPVRARERRRRLHPHPGSGQRARRAEAHAGSARPGPDVPPDARPAGGRRGGDPVGARHGHLLERGGEGLPRPDARADRRRHPCLSRAEADRGLHRRHRRPGDARGRGTDPRHGRAPRVLGPPRGVDRPTDPGRPSRTTSSSTGASSPRPSSGPDASSTGGRGMPRGSIG